MPDPTTSHKIIPVSILTGFLGAGKTTLLNYILRGQSKYKFAVIVNEIGKIGIDGQLVENQKDEIVEMSNGCVCCTVRKDLVQSIQTLLKTRRVRLHPHRDDGHRRSRPRGADVREHPGAATLRATRRDHHGGGRRADPQADRRRPRSPPSRSRWPTSCC